MKKIFKLTLLFLAMIVLVGCGDDKEEAKFHYKPEIFKHDRVIMNSSAVNDEVSRSMIDVNVEGKTNEQKLGICQHNLIKLENQLTALKETRELLKDEKNLTKDEKAEWDYNYKNSIKGIQDHINRIKEKALKYMKTDE